MAGDDLWNDAEMVERACSCASRGVATSWRTRVHAVRLPGPQNHRPLAVRVTWRSIQVASDSSAGAVVLVPCARGGSTYHDTHTRPSAPRTRAPRRRDDESGARASDLREAARDAAPAWGAR
eukprot:6478099-Prymnesium_polylepis.2